MIPNFEIAPLGLLPVIVQDSNTKNVLMLGYMNAEAWATTQRTKKVTFYSRSKQRLWTKGEESGNYLHFISASVDCDADTLLLQAEPQGPTCHKGTDTCWGTANTPNYGFLTHLETVITQRKSASESDKSYVKNLFDKGINSIAQKVGEEAVETVIEAKDSNEERFLNESADLLFHFLVLLQAKNVSLDAVIQILKQRHTTS
jgi:phosphoribosyl-ATP pyrophosphohydrolase/phosphoribosyl-AMP cyclohydrolase